MKPYYINVSFLLKSQETNVDIILILRRGFIKSPSYLCMYIYISIHLFIYVSPSIHLCITILLAFHAVTMGNKTLYWLFFFNCFVQFFLSLSLIHCVCARALLLQLRVQIVCCRRQKGDFLRFYCLLCTNFALF